MAGYGDARIFKSLAQELRKWFGPLIRRAVGAHCGFCRSNVQPWLKNIRFEFEIGRDKKRQKDVMSTCCLYVELLYATQYTQSSEPCGAITAPS